MKLVIIESPYKGNVDLNKRYLRACIRDCINRAESPYASHRMLTDALDDNDPVERTLGIEAGLAWRNAHQIVVHDESTSKLTVSRITPTRVLPVFFLDLGWSSGMYLAKKCYDEEGIIYEERKLPADDLFFTPVAATPGLTEDELTELSVFAPNLACVIEREPPKEVEETRRLAREELAWLIRGARLNRA